LQVSDGNFLEGVSFDGQHKTKVRGRKACFEYYAFLKVNLSFFSLAQFSVQVGQVDVGSEVIFILFQALLVTGHTLMCVH